MSCPARHSQPPPDALGDLLRRVTAGDEPALATLYDATARYVYGLALRVLDDAGAAEEVTLDVYQHIWTRADQFDRQRGSAHGWILAIARNRAIDRRRARAAADRRDAQLTEQGSDPMDPRPDPHTRAMLADRGERVLRAMDSLSAEQRAVIELAFFAGESHGQIATRLRLPLGTVKTRIRCGIRHLARLLAPLEDDR